ncbi:hypothetical protein Q1695_011722 [Nippostrongylus brasiliensis]|nr:hypothetical protein Q1695_011722 [Nippostrongylus brasiliensis]
MAMLTLEQTVDGTEPRTDGSMGQIVDRRPERILLKANKRPHSNTWGCSPSVLLLLSDHVVNSRRKENILQIPSSLGVLLVPPLLVRKTAQTTSKRSPPHENEGWFRFPDPQPTQTTFEELIEVKIEGRHPRSCGTR